MTRAKRRGAWADGSVLEARAGRSHVAWLTCRADLVLTTLRFPRVVDGSHLRLEVERRVGQWTRVVRPGGHVVVVVRQHRHQDGSLADLASAVLVAARSIGLVPVDRCVALLTRLSDIRIGLRPLVTRVRAGVPIASVVHHDVVVLRAPDVVEAGLAMGQAELWGRAAG